MMERERQMERREEGKGERGLLRRGMGKGEKEGRKERGGERRERER